MSATEEQSDALLAADTGQPPFERRLTDKILSAFNHALALGYSEIAERLFVSLELAEREGVRKYGERRGVTALDIAGLWRGFIGARDQYLRLSAEAGIQPERIADARSRMRDAWRQWSKLNAGTKLGS